MYLSVVKHTGLSASEERTIRDTEIRKWHFAAHRCEQITRSGDGVNRALGSVRGVIFAFFGVEGLAHELRFTGHLLSRF